jgi:ABC-type proline/glycine betaine transport system ATPase subunit
MTTGDDFNCITERQTEYGYRARRCACPSAERQQRRVISADETGVTTWKDYRHEGPDRYKTMTLPTALVRALVNDPKLLILDEPLGQLDSLKFEPQLQLRHFCSPYHQDSALLGLRCEVLGNHAEV